MHCTYMKNTVMHLSGQFYGHLVSPSLFIKEWLELELDFRFSSWWLTYKVALSIEYLTLPYIYSRFNYIKQTTGEIHFIELRFKTGFPQYYQLIIKSIQECKIKTENVKLSFLFTLLNNYILINWFRPVYCTR